MGSKFSADKILELSLGIVTSVGGFLEIGSILTAVQAGAEYRLQLIWAVLLGGLCLIFLVEMAGRFAAISKHSIPDALRERFGLHFFTIHTAILTLVSFLVLASEIGGVCVGLEIVTGVSRAWWALPAAFISWALLWFGTFSVIEQGVSLLGLITLSFVWAAVKVSPPLGEVARGVLPSLPSHDPAHYWFIAVSILGASVSPYLFYFYSAGAIEDRWDESHLPVNRFIAGSGMSFGSGISAAVLIAAAGVLAPHHPKIDSYTQAPPILSEPLGHIGYILFGCCMFIACLGAAEEISLQLAYLFAEGFGWNAEENERPRRSARFSISYTVILLLAGIVMCFGIDPLKLTLFSVALTSATLPLSTMPFLILMNDKNYLGAHTNSRLSNYIVAAIVLLGAVLAIVTLPLEIFGS